MMAAWNTVEPFGEPVLEPEESGPGPDAEADVSTDEFLAGVGDHRPGATLALTWAADRLRGFARRHRIIAGVAAASALGLAFAAVAFAARPAPSRFEARVTAGGYRLDGTDRVVSTLTVANPGRGPVTLARVAVGGPGGQDIGLGDTAVDVAIPAGATREVTVRGTLDCRTGQPALPAQVQLTGTDAHGRSGTVSAALPGSAAFAASVDTYRQGICRVPYPLGVTSIRYEGLETSDVYPGDSVAMRLGVTVAAVPGMDPTTVRFTTVISPIEGVRAMLSPADDIAVSPGTPGTLDVFWVVDDCSLIPAYAGIPALSVMGVDRRGTQLWDYALGDRFNADLLGGIAAICHGAGHR